MSRKAFHKIIGKPGKSLRYLAQENFKVKNRLVIITTSARTRLSALKVAQRMKNILIKHF